MRAMKGLLLGTAAGLFAVASAQAADLPVKAKPVEYVKVCSLYGAGFFYVPGTETCLKIGMYLRSEHDYGIGAGNYLIGPGVTQRYTLTDTPMYNYRARMALTTDWRTQTDYGVLRAYALLIAQQSSNDASSQGVAGVHRAFIQFAGFTFGHAVSYFDFFNGAAYGYSPSIWIGSTGVTGTDLVAYTWQLGNGWSASIDIEDGRVGRPNVVANFGAATPFAVNGATTGSVANSSAALNAPDVAGNVRIDQAWGSAQLMAAVHNASAGYYTPGTTLAGHPSSVYGWAVGFGFKINNFGAPKDVFEFQANYAKGATGYIWSEGLYGALGWFGSGNNIGLGFSTDGIYTTGGSVQLTEAWGFAAAYEHYWTPQWRTAVVGGYTEINYNGTATAIICAQANPVGGFTALSNCSPNYSLSAVSTRTAWNPHPTLEIGLDLLYAHLDTAFAGTATLTGNVGARPAGAYNINDRDMWGAIFRVQKTVLP